MPPTCRSASVLRTARVLRDYLDTVRDVERRVEKAEARMLARVESPADVATRSPNAWR